MFPLLQPSRARLGSPSAASALRTHRQLIVHLGPAEATDAFARARMQAVREPGPARMILAFMGGSPTTIARQLEAVTLCDTVLVVTEPGIELDGWSLHKLCLARTLGQPIEWFENPVMYCPRCRGDGPCAEHFFHQALSLADLNAFLARCRGEHLPYLEGQFVNWYGQMVPVALLPNGLPALLVHITCSYGHYVCSTYACANKQTGEWDHLMLPPPEAFQGRGTRYGVKLVRKTLVCQICGE